VSSIDFIHVQRSVFSFAPRSDIWPPGKNFGVKLSPQGWGPSVCPFILLKGRVCSPLRVNEGVITPPRDQSSPLGANLAHVVKNWPQYKTDILASVQSWTNSWKKFSEENVGDIPQLINAVLKHRPYFVPTEQKHAFSSSQNSHLYVSTRSQSYELWIYNYNASAVVGAHFQIIR
jgi:hypothetical protein